MSIDPSWLKEHKAQEGEAFDLVLDVRPSTARAANPYPATCVEIFADELLEDLRWLEVGFPPESCRICCVCWTGMRAARCVFHLCAGGWEASWWALSPVARSAFEN